MKSSRPAASTSANTWQGNFPHENLCSDGFARTSPVTAFPPNDYGIQDMIGNVWEWTSDWYSAKHEADAAKACCIPENPRGGLESGSYNPRQPNSKIPRKVIKGGSHLCAPNYCRRYRPAARHAEDVDTSTIGPDPAASFERRKCPNPAMGVRRDSIPQASYRLSLRCQRRRRGSLMFASERAATTAEA